MSHHPMCYQALGHVPRGLPRDLCDCRTLRMTGVEPPIEYVVGLWHSIPRAARLIRHGEPGLARLVWRSSWRYLAYQARRRNWRAIRMHTIKPYRCESVGDAPRCGSGWTPAGARRSLARLIGAPDDR